MSSLFIAKSKNHTWLKWIITVVCCSAFFMTEAVLGDNVNLNGQLQAKYSKKVFAVPLQANPKAEQLATMMLDLFDSADTQFRLMVTPSLLKKIRKQKHVELLLDDPVRTTPDAFGGREINVKSLLVPLDGKFSWISGQNCTLFYGDPEIQEFNVLGSQATKAEHERFIQLLQEIDTQ